QRGEGAEVVLGGRRLAGEPALAQVDAGEGEEGLGREGAVLVEERGQVGPLAAAPAGEEEVGRVVPGARALAVVHVEPRPSRARGAGHLVCTGWGAAGGRGVRGQGPGARGQGPVQERASYLRRSRFRL